MPHERRNERLAATIEVRKAPALGTHIDLLAFAEGEILAGVEKDDAVERARPCASRRNPRDDSREATSFRILKA